MIHIIVATISEARPFIVFYKLKKKSRIKEFDIYENSKKNLSLTISGIGKLSAAIATCYTFVEYEKKRNQIWLNFGLAGTKDLKIGELAIVNKVEDASSKYKFYPYFFRDLELNRVQCTTYEKPNFNYDKNLSDMEASGFFSSANKFTSKELIFSLKIISDNSKEKLDFKNKEEVFSLIYKKITQIDKFIKQILEIEKEDFFNYKLENQIREITSKYRFSFSQEIKLKKILHLCNLNNKHIVDLIKKDFKDSNHVLKKLENYIENEI